MASKIIDTIWITHGMSLIGFVKTENEVGERKIYSGIVGPPFDEETDAVMIRNTGGKVEPALFKLFLELHEDTNLTREPHDDKLLTESLDEVMDAFDGIVLKPTFAIYAKSVAKRYLEKTLGLGLSEIKTR